MLLDLIYFIFGVLRHPLYMLFPKTISDLETVLVAGCPNPKYSCLYQINDISSERNGVLRPALYGKRCNAELSFERKILFGKTKMVSCKTYPFLTPSEWMTTFFLI